MPKRVFVLIGAFLICAAAAGAGQVYNGACSACGYKADDLLLGHGPDESRPHGLYYARDWKAVVVVNFDLTKALAEEAGLGPGNDPEAYWTAYEKWINAWSYPVVIEAGKLPTYAEVAGAAYQGKPTPRLELVESGISQEGVAYPCPRCGQVKLVFVNGGKWD
jgi:hypothetical protein